MIHHLLRKLGTAGLLILMIGLVAGGIVPQAIAAPAAQAGPTTWTVLVGGQAEVVQQGQGPAGAWQFMRYYPGSITILAASPSMSAIPSSGSSIQPNPTRSPSPNLGRTRHLT
ncbi:MAG: hypothetical protein P8186_19285 [Anaerolineae bacterium]